MASSQGQCAREMLTPDVSCMMGGMPEIMDDTTIAAAFPNAVSAYAGRPFLAVPANEDRSYLPSGFEMSYGEAGRRVEELAASTGRRATASATASQRCWRTGPSMCCIRWLSTRIGVCCVPINPDYRAAEIAYLDRPQRARAHPDPGRATGVDRAGLGAEHAPAPCGRVGVVRGIPGEGGAAGTRHATRPRDAGQHPVYLRHDGPTQGLHPVPWL